MTVGGKTYTCCWAMPPAHRCPRPQRRGRLRARYLPLRHGRGAARFAGHQRPQRSEWRQLARWTARLPVVVRAEGRGPDDPPTFIGIYSYEHSMAAPRPPQHAFPEARRAAAHDRPHASTGRQPAARPVEMGGGERAHAARPDDGDRAAHLRTGPLADCNWPNAPLRLPARNLPGLPRQLRSLAATGQGEARPTQTHEPGHFAQDALAKGNIYGYVSFSDHGSTHNSWAGVWAPTEDRKGLLDAMYDRRTQPPATKSS